MINLRRLSVMTVGVTALSACAQTDSNLAQASSNHDSMTKNPSAQTPDVTSTSSNGMKPARDGNIAIQEEFAAAELKGTKEAYELFIARHPGHELTKIAKERLAKLKT